MGSSISASCFFLVRSEVPAGKTSEAVVAVICVTGAANGTAWFVLTFRREYFVHQALRA